MNLIVFDLFDKKSTNLQTLFIIRCYYSVCLIENGLYAQLLFNIILFIMCINTDKCIIWTVPHITAFKFKCCSLDEISRDAHQLSVFVLFPCKSQLLAHLLPFYASLSTCASFNPPTIFFFQDLLRCRVLTSGIFETRFQIDKVNFQWATSMFIYHDVCDSEI